MTTLDPATRVIACLRRFAFHSGVVSQRLCSSVKGALEKGGVAYREADGEYQILTESGVAIICHAPAQVLQSASECARDQHVESVVLVTFAAISSMPRLALVGGKPFHVLQVGGSDE